jgi:Trk-type K+ transport system membrane component
MYVDDAEDHPLTQFEDSRYFIDHLLPQIAFDLWPIILATGTICVVERTQLLSSGDYGWFTIWNIMFEVTSGYATVGSSLGNPNSTASFSGSFRKISKLVVSPHSLYTTVQSVLIAVS